MGDTVLIETTADEVVSIVTAGPQGPSGSEAATLTTTGDLLYRAALANDRLPIGSEGQVLKVSSGLPAWGAESGAVTSVNGATGAVTVATTAQGALADSAVQPGDLGTAATSDTGDFAAASHTHGNLSNDGKIGSTSGLPLKTGTAGAVEAGAFGTGAGEFCEGNDARLSDARTPLSHAASHAAAGSDPVFDQDLNTTDGVEFAAVRTESLSINDLLSGFSAEIDPSGGLSDDRTYSVPDANGTIALTADIPDPSSATPQALGSASAGTSDDYSRADHVHGAPALNDLSNVSAAAPSDNDVLVYDNATSTWVAEAPAASGIAETLLDAKGDLIVASAADTAARLAVGGTDGHVLTVDSNETLGVKWAAASASNMTGATSSVAGAAGLVPQPAAGKEEMALLGSGEFHVPFVPIIKTETTRGAANTKRWLVAPLCETAAAGSSGGADYEFCGGYVYIPYTGSFYYATVPAALYTTNTKTYWGLYNLASDGLPGTLAYDLGELDVGAGSGVICESANSISLNKGWYCCVSRANGSFNLWSPQSAQWLDHILGKYALTSNSAKRRFYRSLTYSTSLSSDLTSTTWTEGNATAPNLFFRRA